MFSFFFLFFLNLTLLKAYFIFFIYFPFVNSHPRLQQKIYQGHTCCSKTFDQSNKIARRMCKNYGTVQRKMSFRKLDTLEMIIISYLFSYVMQSFFRICCLKKTYFGLLTPQSYIHSRCAMSICIDVN